jgi:DNA-binding GntR family transcriptional regulator
VQLQSESSDRLTAHQFVRETLRRAILKGQLPPGSRLVQAEVATQLAVSTTPVREALRDLASDGLVRLDAHRGAVVVELSRAEADEIYRIRQLLEPEVMRRAVANITEAELDQAESLLGQAEVEEDAARWVELNRRFHRVFIDAAQSPRLASIVETLNDAAAMYVAAFLFAGEASQEAADAQHREILAATRARDEALVAQLIVNHIHATVEGLPELPSASEPAGLASTNHTVYDT